MCVLRRERQELGFAETGASIVCFLPSVRMAAGVQDPWLLWEASWSLLIPRAQDPAAWHGLEPGGKAGPGAHLLNPNPRGVWTISPGRSHALYLRDRSGSGTVGPGSWG